MPGKYSFIKNFNEIIYNHYITQNHIFQAINFAMLFTLYLIPNRLNYIINLNLPTNIAKLYTVIQHNDKQSVMKIVRENLTKQNENKNNIRNKKPGSAKPRFAPREHPSTSPILTFKLSPSNSTTATKDTQSTTAHFQPQ